jgi:hypothetical protein
MAIWQCSSSGENVNKTECETRHIVQIECKWQYGNAVVMEGSDPKQATEISLSRGKWQNHGNGKIMAVIRDSIPQNDSSATQICSQQASAIRIKNRRSCVFSRHVSLLTLLSTVHKQGLQWRLGSKPFSCIPCLRSQFRSSLQISRSSTQRQVRTKLLSSRATCDRRHFWKSMFAVICIAQFVLSIVADFQGSQIHAVRRSD